MTGKRMETGVLGTLYSEYCLGRLVGETKKTTKNWCTLSNTHYWGVPAVSPLAEFARLYLYRATSARIFVLHNFSFLY